MKQRKEEIKAAATYIPNPDRTSIIGDGRLDFQVRNGAGYNPPSRATAKKGKDILVKMCLPFSAIGALKFL